MHRLTELKASDKLEEIDGSALQAMAQFGATSCGDMPEVRANLVEILGLFGVAVIGAKKRVSGNM